MIWTAEALHKSNIQFMILKNECKYYFKKSNPVCPEFSADMLS